LTSGFLLPCPTNSSGIVTVDRVASDWIALLFAGIARVALHGVDLLLKINKNKRLCDVP